MLAAGAIQPKEGFATRLKAAPISYCVGMYGYSECVEDVNLALDVLRGPLVREDMADLAGLESGANVATWCDSI